MTLVDESAPHWSPARARNRHADRGLDAAGTVFAAMGEDDDIEEDDLDDDFDDDFDEDFDDDDDDLIDEGGDEDEDTDFDLDSDDGFGEDE